MITLEEVLETDAYYRFAEDIAALAKERGLAGEFTPFGAALALSLVQAWFCDVAREPRAQWFDELREAASDIPTNDDGATVDEEPPPIGIVIIVDEDG